MKKLKLDYQINEGFTHKGKDYVTRPAIGSECNLCKGCDFAELITEEDDTHYGVIACNAPNNLLCCTPNRIFKKTF